MSNIFDTIDYDAFMKAMDGVKAKKIAACFNKQNKEAEKRKTKNSNKKVEKPNKKAIDFVLEILKEQDLSNKEIESEISEKYAYKNIVAIRKALKELIAAGKVKIVNGKIQIVANAPGPSARRSSVLVKRRISKRDLAESSSSDNLTSAESTENAEIEQTDRTRNGTRRSKRIRKQE